MKSLVTINKNKHWFTIILIGVLFQYTINAQTIDLTTLNSSVTNLPTGTSITWHIATPATDANKIADPTSVSAGTYYAAFYDSTYLCYSDNTIAVPVVSNSCPVSTVDLTTLSSNITNLPTGTSVTYHTATPATDGNKIADPTSVSAGTYYAAFYDSTYLCYSDNTTPIFVTTSLCADVMITQIYHSSTLGKVIEVTNLSSIISVPSNSIKLALYTNKSGDQTGITPDATYTVSGELSPNQSALIKTGSLSGITFIKSPVEENNASITNFSGGNDILILTTEIDNTAWVKRKDVIENFSDNTCYVRIDETTLPNITYSSSEWVKFVDDNLDPYRDLASGGPQRHPHDPLLSEINSPNTEANIGLGLHRVNPTIRTFNNWNNGYPDRSRSVFISENYIHINSKLSARKLTINSNSKLTIIDNPILVTNEIMLTNNSDEIRLSGSSQLIQTHIGNTLVSGNGKLLVDQNSEVANIYRYNYMGSPVSSIGQNTYTVANVLNDGTVPTSATSVTKSINFISGYDGSPGNPINIAEYWIYAYPSGTGGDNWIQRLSSGTIPTTNGFIFKGPGIAQNYTFSGTPNDGNLTTTVGASESYLLSNPYSSALSIKKFIEDNINSIDGSLYFWEHIGEDDDSSSSTSGHNYEGYIGGYATRNISMGLAANQVAFNNNDSGSGIPHLGDGIYKAPGTYVPIAQGFFIGGSSSGGSIIFNNSQREYITEGNNSVFYKNSSSSKRKNSTELSIIKLGMDYFDENNLKLHRQIGVSFNSNNSFDYDNGYDTEILDLNKTDIYIKFSNNDKKYVIAGVQDLNDDLEIPLEIVVDNDQEISLTIDEWQNINKDIYLLNKTSNESLKLGEDKIKLDLNKGTYSGIYFITFKEPSLAIDEELIEKNIKVYIDRISNQLVIINESDIIIKNLVIYNLLGQKILKWKNIKNKKNKLNIISLLNSIYIVKISTNKGEISRKISITK